MTNFNEIYILRLIEYIEKETTGILNYSNLENSIVLHSLELPWLNNKEDISCIAAGRYPYKIAWSPKRKMNVIRLYNVPGRTDIEIHIANWVKQLLGCVAVGKERVDIDGDGLPDVGDSKKAFDKLISIIPKEGFVVIDDSFLKRVNI